MFQRPIVQCLSICTILVTTLPAQSSWKEAAQQNDFLQSHFYDEYMDGLVQVPADLYRLSEAQAPLGTPMVQRTARTQEFSRSERDQENRAADMFVSSRIARLVSTVERRLQDVQASYLGAAQARRDGLGGSGTSVVSRQRSALKQLARHTRSLGKELKTVFRDLETTHRSEALLGSEIQRSEIDYQMERLSLVVANSSQEVQETLAGQQAVSPTLLIRLHHLQLRARLVAEAL